MSVPSFLIPDVECHPETFACTQLASERRVFLGALKEPPDRTARLRLINYMRGLATIPPPPNTLDRATKAMKSIRQTYGNTQQGDCVVASGEHGEGIATANDSDSGGERISSDSESLSEYHRIGGPGDNGLVPSEALEDWRVNGLACGGSRRKLEAWGTFNPADPVQTKTVLILFGGRLTFNVPAEYINNAVDGAVWDRVTRYNFVGGHDVRMIDYNGTGVRIATWGLIITVTWAALADSRVFDAGYFELLPDWTNADGISGSGVKVATLEADVQKIKNGELPSWEPDGPGPGPGPNPPPATHGVVIIPDQHHWFGTVQGGTYPVVQMAGSHGALTLPWLKIIRDAAALAAAVAAQNWPLVITLAIQLANDFRSQQHLMVAMQASVAWGQLFQDLLKLVADVESNAGIQTIIEDAKAIARDLGVNV